MLLVTHHSFPLLSVCRLREGEGGTARIKAGVPRCCLPQPAPAQSKKALGEAEGGLEGRDPERGQSYLKKRAWWTMLFSSITLRLSR